MAKAEYLRNWPEVKTRLRTEEVEILNARLKAEGLSLAQWIRSRLGVVTLDHTIDPNVESFSRKIPELMAVHAHDALILQSQLHRGTAECLRKDLPAESARHRRLSVAYVESGAFFGGIMEDYALLHERQKGSKANGIRPA